MSDKQIKARVKVKADLKQNWDNYGNSVTPLEREPIFYSDTGDIKLGNGVTTVNQLPFFNKRVIISATEPDNVKEGDIWIDTSTTTTLYAAEEVSF